MRPTTSAFLTMGLYARLLTSCRALHSSAPIAPAALSTRLQRLVDFIPPSASGAVADIGCDHGLVSSALLWQRPSLSHVFACDRSAKALASAKEQLQLRPTLPSGPTLHFLLGDGLEPLLHNSPTPVLVPSSSRTSAASSSTSTGTSTSTSTSSTSLTLILSGMGVSTLIDILHGPSLALLEASGWRVDRLVLQPWPPYLLPMSRACVHVLQDLAMGFDYEGQSIDAERGGNYITTSFTRSSGASLPLCRLTPVDLFARCPLYLKYGRGSDAAGASTVESGLRDVGIGVEATCVQSTEQALWASYLETQCGDLRLRCELAAGTNNAEAARFYSLLMQTPSKSNTLKL